MTGKQRRYLRGLAHHLNPVVIIGQRGLEESVVRQVDAALLTHELIKVKLGGECPLDRREAADLIAAQTGCDIAGSIGKVLVLYRRRPENPTIVLPENDRASEE